MIQKVKRPKHLKIIAHTDTEIDIHTKATEKLPSCSIQWMVINN